MKKIIVTLLVAATLSAEVVSVAHNLRDLKNMNREQLVVADNIWSLAVKEKLQYTAIAIGWQESRLGQWTVNLADPSCGYFHKLLPEYAEELKIKPNNWNMSRLCENLQDMEESYKVFARTFEQKRSRCKFIGASNNWRCSVSGYNGSGIRAREYMENIVNKVRALKIWVKRGAPADLDLENIGEKYE